MDMTHKRRARGRKGPTVSFTKEMCLTVAKDIFLSDPLNKQNFLQLLGDNLQMAGCDVFHATSDADVLIVQKAIESADIVKYCEKVAKGEIRVEPKSLPPTSAAAKFHSYRVFLQVGQWKIPDCDLDPESWGWINSDTGFHPVLTDLPPAPDNLLRMIRCNCSGDCSRAWCSCKKHGTKCTLACGQCRGSACTNSSIMVVEEEDFDSD